jgi:hypothetical protein
MEQSQGGQAVNTVPDKCPFCESPIMVHGGNLLRSADGGFASYECKTVQDIELSDDEWKRAGQSDACRKREVQLLTKQRDEARERIKRLKEVGDAMCSEFKAFCPLGSKTRDKWSKAKEAKP